MSVTVFLANPIDDGDHIECEEAKVIGDLVWAQPDDGDQELVIPLSNVTGVAGESVEQGIEALEAPGGQFTELVTDIR